MTHFSAFLALAAVSTGAVLLPAAVPAGSSPQAETAQPRALSEAPAPAVGTSAAGLVGPVKTPPAETRPPPVGKWTWPLSPQPRVVRSFAVGPSPWSPGHRGVDLAAASGAAVRAPAGGTVRFAGVIAGRPVLSIDHGGGLISSLEPVSSALRAGQPVSAGDPVGRLAPGPTHCAPGVCLHWGVRRAGRYIDPLLLVPGRRGPAVLLPLPR